MVRPVSWLAALLAALVIPAATSATQNEIVQSLARSGLRPEDVIVTLERTVCFGSCPAYKLSLKGTGEVTYEGRRYVKLSGVRTGSVEEGAVLQLVNRLLAARFFDADAEYAGRDVVSRVGDRLVVVQLTTADANPTILSLRIGGHTATVRVVDIDPLHLREIADEIDQAVEIEQWIGTRCERPRAAIGPAISAADCKR